MPDQTDPRPCLEPSLLTAVQLVEWQRGLGRRIETVPAGIVITYQASLFRGLKPRFGRARRGLLTEVARLPGDVGVAGGFGVGGAGAAMAVEELAALGARSLIAVGVTAALEERLESGQALVVAEAHGGDGVSRPYGAGGTVRPESLLMERLVGALARAAVPFETGSVWSIDAPYRETRSDADAWRRAGAVAVDMETAALFASASALGLSAAAVLVAADSLTDRWTPPPDAALVQRRLLAAARAAVECLRA